MSVIYILLGIITAIILGYGVKTFWRAEELDEIEEELNKYSVYLEERSSKLASEEEALRKLRKGLYQARDGQRIIQESGEDVR